MKLSPCPFCGCKKIETYDGDINTQLPMVCCSECPCALEHCDYTLEELKVVWNKRFYHHAQMLDKGIVISEY